MNDTRWEASSGAHAKTPDVNGCHPTRWRVTRWKDGTFEELRGPSGRVRTFGTYRGAACAATEQNWKEPKPRPPMPKPDPYKKTDMQHAIEGYCPSCGSNESIDVVEAASTDQIAEADPVGDWCASETLHCNRCGKDFEQLYAMKFDGQKRGGTSSYCGYVDPVRPGGDIQEKAEYLVRDIEAFIALLDTLAEQADAPDAVTWCDGYRTEIGVHKDIADDPKLKYVRQRLLEIKPYLG